MPNPFASVFDQMNAQSQPRISPWNDYYSAMNYLNQAAGHYSGVDLTQGTKAGPNAYIQTATKKQNQPDQLQDPSLAGQDVAPEAAASSGGGGGLLGIF